MSDIENKEEKPAGKSVQDRAKEIGRDGAYLEVAASDILASSQSGELAKASMIVITSLRLDVSDPDTVAKFKALISKNHIAPQEMNSEQASVFIFRKIFEKGIDTISRE